ncbi:MAG TPA: tetratricopeptide repeat protein, partial [Chthoniobacteraceae bacterium]
MSRDLDQVLERGWARHQEGGLAEAETLYREVLAKQPNRSDALRLLALLANQAGHSSAAVELAKRWIALEPESAEAYLLLGVALRSSGHPAEGVDAYRKSLKRSPHQPEALCNLANALQDLGRPAEALEACDQAVEFDPAFAPAHFGRGLALIALDRNAEAAAAGREAVRLDPAHVDAWNNLGDALHRSGILPEAVAAYQEALKRNPEHLLTLYNLGNAFQALHDYGSAIAAYAKVLTSQPRNTSAGNNLGMALLESGRFSEAASAFSEVLRIEPNHSKARNNLGVALQRSGKIDEAIAEYRRALTTCPDYASGYFNLGNAFEEKGLYDEAAAAFRRCLEIQPGNSRAWNNLGNCARECGAIDEAIACYREAMAADPTFDLVHSNLVYSLSFHPDYDARRILAEARCWNRRHGRRFHRPGSFTNDRTAGRRLRVGFLSPNFRRHVVGRNLLPLLRERERESYKAILYSDVVQADSLTAEFRRLADEWRDVAGMSDGAVAELVQRDRVDILVDLTLHMANNRLQVFARKAAPVQLSYLGYCGPTGLEAMDFRLSDRHLDPPEAAPLRGDEKIIRLKHSYWCYEPLDDVPAVNRLPALETGILTFGCLNHFAKVSAQALKLWARILARIPGSRLLLQAPPGAARERVSIILESAGILRDRVAFVGTLPWPEYVRAWQQVDVALDPFPYGGGITSCDALWLGVPVVSLIGKTAVGRSGLSILANLDLVELAVNTEAEYVAAAATLGGDLARLSELRNAIRSRFQR